MDIDQLWHGYGEMVDEAVAIKRALRSRLPAKPARSRTTLSQRVAAARTAAQHPRSGKRRDTPALRPWERAPRPSRKMRELLARDHSSAFVESVRPPELALIMTSPDSSSIPTRRMPLGLPKRVAAGAGTRKPNARRMPVKAVARPDRGSFPGNPNRNDPIYGPATHRTAPLDPRMARTSARMSRGQSATPRTPSTATKPEQRSSRSPAGDPVAVSRSSAPSQAASLLLVQQAAASARRAALAHTAADLARLLFDAAATLRAARRPAEPPTPPREDAQVVPSIHPGTERTREGSADVSVEDADVDDAASAASTAQDSDTEPSEVSDEAVLRAVAAELARHRAEPRPSLQNTILVVPTFAPGAGRAAVTALAATDAMRTEVDRLAEEVSALARRLQDADGVTEARLADILTVLRQLADRDAVAPQEPASPSAAIHAVEEAAARALGAVAEAADRLQAPKTQPVSAAMIPSITFDDTSEDSTQDSLSEAPLATLAAPTRKPDQVCLEFDLGMVGLPAPPPPPPPPPPPQAAAQLAVSPSPLVVEPRRSTALAKPSRSARSSADDGYLRSAAAAAMLAEQAAEAAEAGRLARAEQAKPAAYRGDWLLRKGASRLQDLSLDGEEAAGGESLDSSCASGESRHRPGWGPLDEEAFSDSGDEMSTVSGISSGRHENGEPGVRGFGGSGGSSSSMASNSAGTGMNRMIQALERHAEELQAVGAARAADAVRLRAPQHHPSPSQAESQLSDSSDSPPSSTPGHRQMADEDDWAEMALLAVPDAPGKVEQAHARPSFVPATVRVSRPKALPDRGQAHRSADDSDANQGELDHGAAVAGTTSQDRAFFAALQAADAALDMSCGPDYGAGSGSFATQTE
jgi:hypothetical protein